MKKKKLFMSMGIVAVLVIAVATVSFAAATYGSPAEMLAGLTGKSVDEVVSARQDGETFGAQAEDAGVLEQFRAYHEERFEARLDEWVEDGRITQEEADQKLATFEERQANCDGEGPEGKSRLGFGQGQRGSGGRGYGTCLADAAE